MEIIIRPDADDAAGLVAEIIADELRAKPDLVLGLATGRTMEPAYASLVKRHRLEKLDFSKCRTFNLDEYVGLPAKNPNSFRHFMNHHLFLNVNIDLRNTHLPDGMAENLKAECADYERLIAQCGGIDLQLLGIGTNGHIGFNEPPSGFHSRTRAQKLSAATRSRNAELFSSPGEVPKRAITMGLGTILDCRRCLLLATGADKAGIVAQAIEGAVTGMVPASALQLHFRCTIILDKAAAQCLKERKRG